MIEATFRNHTSATYRDEETVTVLCDDNRHGRGPATWLLPGALVLGRGRVVSVRVGDRDVIAPEGV